MFSDTITYTDFNGKTQSETLFFNISKLEALDLQKSKDFHYEDYLQQVLDSMPENSDDVSKNMEALYNLLDVFKDIIRYGYGEKSEDGKRFMKSDEIYSRFENSAVYEEFLMKLLSEPDYTLSFIVAVLPDSGVSEEELKAELSDSSDDLTDRMKARIEEKKAAANISVISNS